LVHQHLNDMLPPAENPSSPMTLDADAFVGWFAAINVIKTQTAKSDAAFADLAASGNSRDPPSRFQFYCGIGQCQYSSWDHQKVDTHQVSCQGLASSEKYFQCSQCDKSFASEASLASHVGHAHDFQPRSCAKCPDKPDVIYYDQSSLSVHQDKVHRVFDQARLCPLRDDSCNLPDKLYTSARNLYAHLQNVHKQTAEQIRVHIPIQEKVRQPATEWACPLGDVCDQPFKGKNNGDVRNHLKRKHDFSDEDALEMVPLSKAEKTSQKNREAKGPKPKYTWKCPVSDCETKSTLATNHKRRRHLIGVHGWTEERAMNHLPLSGKELASQKNKGKPPSDEGEKEDEVDDE